MSALGTAVRVEVLAWRRSRVQRLTTPLLICLVPLASVGMTALARSGTLSGTGAAKLADYAGGDLATTHLVVSAQILAVAALMAGGFAFAAAFGQPLADGRAGAYVGLATPRGTLALARALVVLAWISACVVAAVVLTVGASAVVTAAASEAFGPTAWPAAGRALVAGLLAAGLAIPFAAIATATRSPLATIGALIGVVALTQVMVLVGAGAWFPYAIPSLWAGTGGPAAAATIGGPALALAAAVAPAAAAVVTLQWQRLTDL